MNYINLKNTLNTIFILGVLTLISPVVLAQCDYAVPASGGTLDVIAYDFFQDADYNQGYFLMPVGTDESTVTATSAATAGDQIYYAESLSTSADAADGEMFTGVVPGDYVLIAINYKMSDFGGAVATNPFNTYSIADLRTYDELAQAGDPCLRITGSSAADSGYPITICYSEGESGGSALSIDLTVCADNSTNTNVSDAIIVEKSAPGTYNANKTQTYVVYDASGNYVMESTEATFTGLAAGVYQVYALNYEPTQFDGTTAVSDPATAGVVADGSTIAANFSSYTQSDMAGFSAAATADGNAYPCLNFSGVSVQIEILAATDGACTSCSANAGVWPGQ